MSKASEYVKAQQENLRFRCKELGPQFIVTRLGQIKIIHECDGHIREAFVQPSEIPALIKWLRETFED